MNSTINSRHSHTADIQDFMPLPHDSNQYSIEFIQHSRALFLGFTPHDSGRQAWVALSRDAESRLKTYLSLFHLWKDSIAPMFISCKDIDIEMGLSRLIGMNDEAVSSTKISHSPNHEGDPLRTEILRGPGQRMLRTILLEAVQRGASDIHFEPGRSCVIRDKHVDEDAVLRIHVHGGTETLRQIHPGMCRVLINGIRILASLEILSQRGPQDGSFSMNVGHRVVRMRCSIVPTLNGLSASIRILNQDHTPTSLEHLGYRVSTQQFLHDCLANRRGLVLFSGPTGCGKTTSMYVLGKEGIRKGLKIISIEEPVELLIPGMEQIEAQALHGLDYSAFLPAALRRKPDILIIGEIRNFSTAELALDAALSGHLVLSTIHSPSPGEAIDRLRSLGINDDFRLNVIRGVIGQNLVHLQGTAVALQDTLHIPENGSAMNSFHSRSPQDGL